MHKAYYVYIMTNKRNGTLYIGMTNNIIRRIYEHKNKKVEGFTKTYSLTQLVYYEKYNYVWDAINREKQLKTWKREWKITIIENENHQWLDLSDQFTALE